MEKIGGAARRVRAVSLIDEGRWGEVFVGLDEVLRRRVVVKRLASASFEDAATRRRLIEEARILSRLDHPNVLRIHDYSEREGFDVFTFEFAPGTKLPEAIDEGKLDFAKKVRIATAVASALVVAHRNGIVHGALSPGSVILAESGEIKVADFSSTSTQLDGRRSDPRWQSPQEKLGDQPSRAGDMYAFGLLLREIFGEKDREVRALVASLVREAPSDRATAAVTFTGLQRLARRPARRIRTAAILLVVAFFLVGGTKYALDLQRERREALAAKAEADARRAEVNKLVSFMIMDLRPKLESVGRLAIMDSAATKGLAYFASINPNDISPNEAVVHIEAFNQLARVQLARANVPASLATLRRAVNLGEEMVRRQPDNLELRYALAHAYASMSNALDRDGDLAGALLNSRACAAAAAELVRRAPDDVRFLMAEAIAHSNLGSMHDRREEIVASLREFATAAAIERRVVRITDTDEIRIDLALTVDKVAMALFKLGSFRDGRAMLEQERLTLQAEADRTHHKEMRRILARYDEHLATIAFATGDIAAASRHAAANLATSGALVQFEPDNVDWLRCMVIAHRTSGTAARLTGDVRSALQHHAAAIATLRGIAEGDRRTTTLIREMAVARVDHARSLLTAGYSSAALDEARRAAAELRQIGNDLPARTTLGEALLVEGEAITARGDRTAAVARWEEALAVFEPLDALSTDPRISDAHARVLLHLGRAGDAQLLIENLAAIGYHHPEFEALVRERGSRTN